MYFNSHTREGVTANQNTQLCERQNFNSHTREGVTAYGDYPYRRRSYFNSHTREGVTETAINDLINSGISTHTPVRV